MPTKLSSNKKPTVKEFLSPFPPNIRVIAEHLRKLIKQAVPDVSEAVYLGWKLIGYRVKSGKDDCYFGFIAPFKDRIELGFEYGFLLSDPDHLLNKKLKQVHSVVMREKN